MNYIHNGYYCQENARKKLTSWILFGILDSVIFMSDKPKDYLKSLRVQHGYTQKEVADFLGVTKATISKYEKGQRHINSEYIERLAQLYEVEPVYILTGITSEEWKRRLDENVSNVAQEERAYWESALLTDAVTKLMPLLDMLNEDGQAKAVERVAELTEVPKYRHD